MAPKLCEQLEIIICENLMTAAYCYRHALQLPKDRHALQLPKDIDKVACHL